MDRNKIWKMVVILAAIVVFASSLSKLASRNSLSLTDYVAQRTDPDTSPESKGQEQTPPSTDSADPSDTSSPAGLDDKTSSFPAPEDGPEIPPLTGAALNGDSCLEQRVTLAEGFYYEPISDKLRRYITGISFPISAGTNTGNETDTPMEIDTPAETKTPAETETPMEIDTPVQTDTSRQTDNTENTINAGNIDNTRNTDPAKTDITLDELRYVHILHYDFDGNLRSGELICNAYIARDLVEIFHELYRNEYKLEKVLLIDEYNGDETASLEDNNTSCFRYSAEDGSHASKHAKGLAVDINPLYNPYITYSQDGSENVTPAASSAYADRSASFPYKINEEDLCYKLFTRHGFTWGGNWNDAKGFLHFQKALNE